MFGRILRIRAREIQSALFLSATLLLASVSMSGCGGSAPTCDSVGTNGLICTPTPTNSPAPTSPACGLPSGMTDVALVYPASGSTGVQDVLSQMIVASSNGGFTLGGTTNVIEWSLDLLPHGTQPVGVSVGLPEPGIMTGYLGVSAAVSPPFPNPSATATFANPVYQSVAFDTFSTGQLQAHA